MSYILTSSPSAVKATIAISRVEKEFMICMKYRWS